MKMNIIPHTTEFKNVPSTRIHWTYLHGKLEKEVGWDIYGVENFIGELDENKRVVPSSFPDGIYECTFKGKDCTLFYWTSGSEKKGLVVYNDDTANFNFAKKSYENKNWMV